MYDVSILVPAYNEKDNIGELLRRLTRQKVGKWFKIKEIVVVASGCTDGTEKEVKKFKEVKLIVEKKRKGKASAINLFLKRAKGDIIVMESADTLPVDDWVIDNLLKPFLNEKVGMTAGRPIPFNKRKSLTNLISSSIWHLHHLISLECPPKVGEIVAFRNIIRKVPEKTAADEESISALIQKKGYKVVYTPSAVVLNKAPERIFEFIEQRKRIFIGHLWIKRYQKYTVPSLNFTLLLKVVISEILKNPFKTFTLLPLSMLEIFARIVGWIEFNLFCKNYYLWNRVDSTKKLD